MKRLALALLALVALPALAQDTATNAPAATLARAEADLRGETFERWRFAVLTDLDALEASYGELRNFFGQLGVSWPPGSSMERSGDHGFVVRNTRENLNAIRMILDILPVTVLWGELVVLEDAPATNAPAATSARAETFERWRFTILPGLDGRVDSTDTWKSFFGQLGVSWPRGSFVEPSGDDGLVVRNTRENLDTIRMIFGGLSVNVLQGEPVVLEDAPATNAPAATNARADDDGWPPLPTAVERLLEEFRTTGDCSSLDEAIWELKLAPVDSAAAALSNRIALVRRLVPFCDPDYDRRNPGPLYMHATPPKGYRTGTPPSAVSDPVERAAYEERIRVHAEEANARNIQHTLRGFFEDAAVFIEMIKPNDREELLRQLPEGFLPATRSPEVQGAHAESAEAAEPKPHAESAETAEPEPHAEAAEEKQ